MKQTKQMPSQTRKVACLIVDDVPENIVALRALLESDDVDVLTAQSGAQALEILLNTDVALAILDVQMPEMNGFELAELMRGAERTRDIPIFFVTAGARDQERLFRGYEAGAVDFIYKPIEADILSNKANVFFQLHRQKLQLAWELKERTEALRLSEMFMAVLGHDLRNPLGAIMASAEMLGMTSANDNVKQFSGRILSSTNRMTRMIEDLLDVTRARVAGGIPIRPQPMDLQPVLDRVMNEIRAIHPKRRIEIETKGDLHGTWDSERLAQVISNLVTNALQHGAQDAPVTVEIDGDDTRELTICVRNGGSIPEHRRAALFDPFHDISRMVESRSGLGLGLYIVREIVVAHGGTADVQSDASNETAFLISLPREEIGKKGVAVDNGEKIRR
jgi:two-component system, sensor histidine kinase and response regulator